jgi:hypothetical protein
MKEKRLIRRKFTLSIDVMMDDPCNESEALKAVAVRLGTERNAASAWRDFTIVDVRKPDAK